jgi:uncharacterized membrane protein
MSAVPKRFWLLLAASVALNLFGIGLAVGRISGLRDRPRGDAIDPRAFLRHSGLREAGPEVRQILRSRRDEVKSRMRELAQAHEQVRTALEIEPYDRAAVEKAFAHTRELTAQMQADMHGALIEVSSKLSPEQRKRMADTLWSRHNKH